MTVPVGAPRPMPPADHVAWARDQFIAWCSGGIVGRCGPLSPVRGLPLHVLCYEIGRNWVMGVAVGVAVGSSQLHREALWFVAVSHTLGVVAIEREKNGATTFNYGWVGVHRMATCLHGPGGARHSAILDTETTTVVAKWESNQNSRSAVVSNEKWQAVYSDRKRAVAIWRKPLVSETNTGGRAYDVKSVSPDDGAYVDWIDLLYTGNGNMAAVSVVMRGRTRALWFVDLETTHKQGAFSITQEFRVEVCEDVYWSDQHGFIGAPQLCQLSGRHIFPQKDHYFLMTVETNKVKRRCTSKPGKVDKSHFYEVSCAAGTVSVFAANDEVPCRVFHLGNDRSFKLWHGLIAFQGEDRIDLVDAVTGRWLWYLPVPMQDFMYDLQFNSF
ncbi:hypothetical protein Pelo_6559 [Pelomyxa schiedti]|nr:hypothetical protein Pelo_6559 [Pelomyxa schiedti]